MSKIPVGQGFLYPDDTEQITAGVVPDTGRDFYFTPAGDNSNPGISDERPVADPDTAIDLINNLNPPVSSIDRASLNASVIGTYSNGLELPRYTAVNSESASILTSDPVALTLGGDQTVIFGSILNFADDGVCININGLNRISSITNALVVGAGLSGSDKGTGYVIEGVCDDVFIQLRQGEIRGVGSIMFDHTAESSTPISYNVGIVEFFDDDQTFMEFNPPNAEDAGIITLDTIQVGNGTANTTAFHAISGRLSIKTHLVQADCVLRVESGGLAGLSSTLCLGNVEINDGASAVITAAGLLFGNITVGNGSSLTIFANRVVGDITVDAGGELDCEILSHTGTINQNGSDSNINGRIDKTNYGAQAVAGALVVNTESVRLGEVFESYGRFELDTNVEEIISIAGYVVRSRPSSSDTRIRVLYSDANNEDDVNNGDVYFIGDLSTSAAGEVRIDLLPTATPVPSLDRAFFQIQARDDETRVRLESVTVSYREKP